MPFPKAYSDFFLKGFLLLLLLFERERVKKGEWEQKAGGIQTSINTTTSWLGVAFSLTPPNKQPVSPPAGVNG